MPYSVGIVGLTNAGKSTIFNALTALQVPCEPYPFCTIDPHRGQVPVSDPRLDKLAEVVKPERVIPDLIEFVDIAGLVKGAHKGEGLGNQFLAEIRPVDAIALVLRCFENPEVAHPEASINPVRDLETVFFELVQKDLETSQRRKEKAEKRLRVGDKDAQKEVELCERMIKALEDLKPLAELEFNEDEREILNEMKPLTLKPLFIIANLGEERLEGGGKPYLEELKQYAQSRGLALVEFYGKIEAEVHELEKEEQELFLKEMGLERSGLEEVIRTARRVLDLITFFTAVGGKELRSWLVPRGTSAVKSAGRIHSDFEQGFIKAEVISFDDFIRVGGEQEARKLGLVRVEGKDYRVQDGDIIHFRFRS